jgi:hypothetical protein
MAETRTKSQESGLTAKQERALVAMLATRTHEAAAKQAELTTATLRRYLRVPAFHDEYLRRRRELMSSAITLAQQHAVSMVQVLVDLAQDPDTPASVRVSAANNVYNIGDAGQRTEDLAESVAKLEELLNDELTIIGIKNKVNGAGGRRR